MRDMVIPNFFSSFFKVVVVFFSYFSTICLSSSFADDNPIKLLSDGQRDNFTNDLDFPRLPVNAIYQFGDSLSDTGNLIRVDPSNNCGFWPYGESLFDKPTGRCSNGLLIVDFFAMFLNLPLLDAYLNKDGTFTHGVNFAVSGATALNVSILEEKYNISSPTTNLSLSVQLGWFKSHVYSIYSSASERKSKLAKGLFLMGEIGGNDYNFAFIQGKSLPDVYKMVPDVIKAIKNAVEEIIDFGATQIAIPGNFPIGCVPLYLSLFKTNDTTMYDNLRCLKQYNSHAKFHNDLLRQTIKELKKDHPNVVIVYMDYFGALKELLQHATLFGFDESEIQEACCGPNDNEYKVNMSMICGTKGVPVCKNPQEHVSWDGSHLTQQAYHVLAKQLMRPINGGVTNARIWGEKYIFICFLLLWGL